MALLLHKLQLREHRVQATLIVRVLQIMTFSERGSGCICWIFAGCLWLEHSFYKWENRVYRCYYRAPRFMLKPAHGLKKIINRVILYSIRKFGAVQTCLRRSDVLHNYRLARVSNRFLSRNDVLRISRGEK